MATEMLNEDPQITAEELQAASDAEAAAVQAEYDAQIQAARDAGRLIKTVDGAHMVMSEEEEAETRAGWAAYAADEPVRAAIAARANRNLLLAQTDWYAIRQTCTSEAMPDAVRTYRQSLRNITQQTGFPLSIVWPELADA